MILHQPSRTALGAAGHRAAHQLLEGGAIFSDPLAVKILGDAAADSILEAKREPVRRALRLFIAARTRFAEDALAAAIARGATQIVILGAGLDTYAYRTPLPASLRVFEIDHPATQAWKRERLAEAAIAIPKALTFAPVDFERDTLANGLANAGFDPRAKTFFTWLGVVPYLTESAVVTTLSFVASLPNGAEIVFDYANPPDSIREPEARAHLAALEARVAAAGEAFHCYFEADTLAERLRATGFTEIEDLGPQEISARYFGGQGGARSGGAGHVIRAARG